MVCIHITLCVILITVECKVHHHSGTAPKFPRFTYHIYKSFNLQWYDRMNKPYCKLQPKSWLTTANRSSRAPEQHISYISFQLDSAVTIIKQLYAFEYDDLVTAIQISISPKTKRIIRNINQVKEISIHSYRVSS